MHLFALTPEPLIQFGFRAKVVNALQTVKQNY